MKLLIVDDEELTRVGVISSIDWDTLGIHSVLQADDGINGLEMARIHQPEIILCDVRMPRMDGITMLEKIETFLPDTVPIFMSGYSDKEYLKAAIKLKAVNYIEKPLDPAEIRQAVFDAREMYLQKMRFHYGETLHSVETASKAALLLTDPSQNDPSRIADLLSDFSFQLTEETYFTSFIVKTGQFQEISISVNTIHEHFQDFLKTLELHCIHTEKRGAHIVYFVFGSYCPAGELLQSISLRLHSLYSSLDKYYIAAGDPVQGISRAYHTYESAVILLQSSFFFANRSILTSYVLHSRDIKERELADSLDKRLNEALISRSYALAEEVCRHLVRFFSENHTLFTNQAKDLYYKLFLAIENARTQQQIPSSLSEQENNISDTMERCFSYNELHNVLTERVEQYFEDAQNAVQENSTIHMIKEYINKNYANDKLSVKDISSHVFLSASYVCTFFKNETGQTLNQYLTEFRMEKAKQLLSDPRYKITEVSSKVGYSDGNYFGKSFKKYSGYSPSEFREKIIL